MRTKLPVLFLKKFVCHLPGYCIVSLDNIEEGGKEPQRSFSIGPFPVMQWSLFATCLFFCSGHWYDATHG